VTRIRFARLPAALILFAALWLAGTGGAHACPG
jgi:hypothetical protein